jgi:uncharacterized protein YcbK (DUF882 family)
MRLRGKVQAALVTAALASACVTGAVHPAAPKASDVESRASAGLFFSPLDLVAAQALLSAPESLPTAQQALAQTSGGMALGVADQADSAPAPSKYVRVQLRNANTHDEFTLEVSRKGEVDSAQATMLEAFLACRRSGRIHSMSPGVLRVLAAVAEEYPGHTIEIISGYRSAPFGVKESKHFEGRAIDLRVKGVKLSKVRDFVWKRFSGVGVGYYMHSNFIHVDHRPDDKDTSWSSTDEDGLYEYNPRWAMRIRTPWQPSVELTESYAEHVQEEAEALLHEHAEQAEHPASDEQKLSSL